MLIQKFIPFIFGNVTEYKKATAFFGKTEKNGHHYFIEALYSDGVIPVASLNFFVK